MKFFLFSLILISSFSTYAFRVDPMSATIELKDNQKHTNFILENSTKEPLPVQINLFERKIKENGEDELIETDEVMAFPDQIIVPPEQKRSVKVTWTGNARELKTEKAFRFVAEQLPLDLKQDKKSKTGIKMLLKYVAALYVNPVDGEARISCELVAKQFVCTNSGTKHQILNFKYLTFEDGKNKIEFKKEELAKINGENILAGGKRVFPLPIEKMKNLGSSVKVNFKLE